MLLLRADSSGMDGRDDDWRVGCQCGNVLDELLAEVDAAQRMSCITSRDDT